MDIVLAVVWWIAVLSTAAIVSAGLVWIFVWYVTRD